MKKLRPVVDTSASGQTYSYAAEVQGSGDNIYHTEVTLDKELKLIDYDCSCPAFETFDGPCKHIAAVAYQLGNHLGGGFGAPTSAAKSLIQLEVGLEDPEVEAFLDKHADEMDSLIDIIDENLPHLGMKELRSDVRAANKRPAPNAARPARVTSSALLQCMDTLEALGDPMFGEVTGSGNIGPDGDLVKVIPSLIWDKGQIRIEITLGTTRQYVVRSLKTFCRSLTEGEPILFGKGLRINGDLNHFDAESKAIVEFFLHQYRQLVDLRKVQDYYRPDDLADQLFVDSGRGMVLTPQALDEFLELMEGRSFLFDKRYRFLYGYQPWNRGSRSKEELGFTIHVRTQSGQPILPLTMTVEDGGISLKAKSLPFRCKGDRHLYLLMDQDSEILWKTDDDYRKKMGPLLDSLERSDKEIFIADRDLPRFCANVFTAVRSWLDIDGDVSYLEQFLPWDMEGQLYLDSPAPGVITARPLADYGVVRVNLCNEHCVDDQNHRVYPAALESTGLRRNNQQETRLMRLLEHYFTEIDPQNGLLVIRDDDDAIYEFLKHGQPALASHVRLFVTERYKRLMFPAKNKMTAGVSIAGDLLKVTFDLEGFPPEELGELLSSYRVKRRYYRLKSGTYLSLEDGELKDAMELASGLQLTKEEMNAGQAQIPRYRALYVDEMARKAPNLTVYRDESFTSLIHSIRDVNESKLAVPASLDPILRDYQKTGFRWLKTMADLGFGGILADDMGLGKTLEIITLLTAASEEAATAGVTASSDVLALVVCPASLVWNWGKELERFTAGKLNAMTVSGTAAVRKKQLSALEELSAEERQKTVVITSYDLLKRDVDLYDPLYFRFHIVDEAQYIKNFTTKNAKAVYALHSGTRFALTGTPIENRLSDLWSIFHFLMPGYLGTYQQFKNQYERPILEEKDDDSSALLQNQVRPFILRRLKQKVLKELPEKVESVVYVPLEGEQEKLYMANLAKVKLEIGATIAEGGFETNKLEILALLTRLRQICCHAALCYEDYRGPSAKLETCMELIREAINGGHRILLFSQFTSMLSLIEDRLCDEGIAYYTLTGQTPKATRQTLVTNFNEGRVPIFLISLKAGGTGLNLTGADIVIHFDPWWNLAAQNQATDRAHRLGQIHSVQVYKLVADNTIEERILRLQTAKGNLADSVISENALVLGGMDEAELRELLGSE